MPRHSETRFLPYTPQQLYELVADIERYPEFLPWCLEVRVLERGPHTMKADLTVGYKAFREKFTSVVTLAPYSRIDVTYVEGPLSHLNNSWRFQDAPGGCSLEFDLDFKFRTSLFSGLFEIFFEQAMRKMSSAFEARALALFGGV